MPNCAPLVIFSMEDAADTRVILLHHSAIGSDLTDVAQIQLGDFVAVKLRRQLPVTSKPLCDHSSELLIEPLT